MMMKQTRMSASLSGFIVLRASPEYIVPEEHKKALFFVPLKQKTAVSAILCQDAVKDNFRNSEHRMMQHLTHLLPCKILQMRDPDL